MTLPAPGWKRPFLETCWRLRCDLGDPFDVDQPVARFLQALGRAKALTAALFAESTCVYAVVEQGIGGAEGVWTADECQPTLSRLGLRAPVLATWQEHDEDTIVDARVYDASDAAARELLLWSPLAGEIGIRPVAAGELWLVDLARGIAGHPYDDRGMDLLSLTHDPLVPLYTDYSRWLNEHARPGIASKFSS